MSTLRRRRSATTFALAALAGVGAGLLLLCALAVGAYNHLRRRARGHTVALRASCLHDVGHATEYVPRTGDLMLLQHLSAGVHEHRDMEGVPTHVGLVWVPEVAGAFRRDARTAAGAWQRALLVEATRFTGPLLRNALSVSSNAAERDGGSREHSWSSTHVATDGVRAVVLADALHAATQGLAFAAVRPLIAGSVNSRALEDVLRSPWAAALRFEPDVGTDMSMLEMLALCTEPAFPRLARAAGSLTRLSRQDRAGRTVFCSEFVAHVLQKLGHLRPDFTEHWFLAPPHFTQSVARIDALCSGPHVPQPLRWGPERVLVCGPTLAT